MRAVAVRAFRGTPELIDLDPPTPGPGEVRVRMVAAGLNPFDWKIIDGVLSGARPHRFPLVVGVDGAGRVESLGPGTSRFQVGDPIFGQFLHDPVGIGTMAEMATVPESIGVTRFPESLGPVEAAALPTAGMTAVDALDRLALPSGGSLILVGASGGIGLFAVQLARARGLRVTAVARGESEDRLLELGASSFVAFGPADLPGRIRAVHPNGADGLLDVVSGPADFARLAGTVRSGGRAASSVGAAEAKTPGAPPGVSFVNLSLQPRSDQLERLLRDVVDRHLTIPLGQVVPLAAAPAAIAASRSGRTTGKTVVRVSEVPGSTGG